MKQFLIASVFIVFTTYANANTVNIAPIISYLLSDTAAPTSKEIAVNKIKTYADDQTQPSPTVQDYIDAGVTGVTSANLYNINNAIAKKNSNEVDTTTEIQAVADNVINNTAPVADAGVDLYAQVNQSITVTGSGTDSDGTITSYEWTKDSIIIATTASFIYTPTGTGTDTLTLIVIDDYGVIASDTMTVTVTVSSPTQWDISNWDELIWQ